jgi:hypothetical protein
MASASGSTFFSSLTQVIATGGAPERTASGSRPLGTTWAKTPPLACPPLVAGDVHRVWTSESLAKRRSSDPALSSWATIRSAWAMFPWVGAALGRRYSSGSILASKRPLIWAKGSSATMSSSRVPIIPLRTWHHPGGAAATARQRR